MGTGAAILAALKAIPELVRVISRLGDSIEKMQLNAIDDRYDKLKEQVNVYTKKIEQAKTNDQRRALARELNAAVSK